MSAIGQTGSFTYYGLLAYIFLFYTQLAGRYPFLAPLRLELVLGSTLLVVSAVVLSRGGSGVLRNSFNYAAIGFFLYIVATIPVAFVKSRVVENLVFIFKFFAIYILIIAGITTEKQVKGFVLFYLGMIALIFVEPFLLSLRGEGFIYNNHMMRLKGVTGYFGHPNQLGMITSIHLPFFYYIRRSMNSVVARAAVWLLILISLRVIMLTMSRTGFLGVLTFVAVVWVNSRRKLAGLLLMAVALGVTWLASPPQTRSRFLTFGEVGRIVSDGRESLADDSERRRALGSMATRWEHVLSALQTFRENPVFGVGLGNAGSYSGNRGGRWSPPHNTYMQALAELGSVGSTFFFLIIFYTLRNLRDAARLLRETRQEDSFMHNAVRGLAGTYIIVLVVSTFGIEVYSNYWWVMGGLALVILHLCREQRAAQLRDSLPEAGHSLSMAQPLPDSASRGAS